MAMLQSLLILLMVFTMSMGNAGRVQNDDRGGHSRCRGGWVEFGGHCYKYFPQTVTWVQAERNCESLGGHLASVSDGRQNNFLLSLVPTSARCWGGADDAIQFGEWFWSDGSTSQYTNWCSGQPDNSGGTESCLEINFTDNRCWNDVSCSTALTYVCAKDQ